MSPLSHLHIIELSSVLAGPAVGMFFAELGATVVKFENVKAGGDVTRRWRLPGEQTEGPSAYYSAVNYRKDVRMVDLTSEAGANAVAAELAKADLVISNFLPETAKKLNVLPEALRERYPNLIIAVIEGYAKSDKPAYDAVLQAETGWIAMNGSENQLAKLPVALIDELAAHQLKQACLLALLHRAKTGQGSIVRCDLESAALSALANQASNYLMTGALAKPIGTAHPNIAPYGDLFTTRDGVQFLLAVGSDDQFMRCCQAFASELYLDHDYFSNSARLANRTNLILRLQAIFDELDFDFVREKLEAQAVPFGKVRTIDEVMASPAARALLREEMQEGRRTIRLSGNAFRADFLDEP